MSINKIIFVEKKQNFNNEANEILNDIKNNLNITTITNVRLIKKYLVGNVDQTTFKKAINSIFSESQVDLVYLDKIQIPQSAHAFAISYLPGQFDQRADSCEQCIKLINHKSEPIIKTANIFIIEGKLSNADFNKIKRYLINPIDSQEIDINFSEFEPIPNVSNEIQIVKDFIKLKKEQIIKFHNSQNLSMSIDDLLFIQQYFVKEKRNPTITEIKVIDTYWSDHCRHTTFETSIDEIKIENNSLTSPIKKTYDVYLKMRNELYGKNSARKISLMDLATIVAKYMIKKNKLKDLDISEENNACSINVNVDVGNKKEKYLLMFKNETHNHPTEIEPFGGAATCLGGAIRDPLSGRSYVYQAMRVSGSGDPTQSISETLPNKLPQRTIALGAAKGYSSYGNQIGLATGLVDEIYHPHYVAKRMEIGAVIGATPKSHVIRIKPTNGDKVILLGGRTGRDGIGGATGSSKSHDEKSIHTLGAQVQKGNPICERKIQRLFKNQNVTKLIKKCNDFGAGGVSVAIGELSDSLDIFLDKVPKKYPSLNATEIALSESQERMAIVVANKDVDKFIKYANEENLEATVVANVTNSSRLKMFYENKCFVDLNRTFLNTNGVMQHIKVNVVKPKTYPYHAQGKIDFVTKWNEITNNLNSCSRHGLIQRFDSSIGANTVLYPLGGRYQLTPVEAMVSKIPTFGKNTSTCSVMSYGFDPKLGEWSPFHMGYYSVIEAVTKQVVTGAKWENIRLSCQEYFEKLGNDKNKWGKPFSALLGALKAQIDLNLPSIGGKDSMSGTFENLNVPPTLVTFAVGIGNADKIVSPEFKQSHSAVCLILPKYLSDKTVDVKSLIKNYTIVSKLINQGLIYSAASLRGNGLAESILKMCVGNKLGVEFNNVTPEELFGVNYGGIVLTISPKNKPQELLKGCNFKIIGKTTSNYKVKDVQRNIEINLLELEKQYMNRLESVFVSNTNNNNQTKINASPYIKKVGKKAKYKLTNPLVVIPVFPGTNCEYDSQIAFEKAGAKVKQVLIKNANAKDLLSSINELSKWIDKANIVMLPGGFSSADEPDGSAKFIVNVFRNNKIKNAVNKLLKQRDGLMLGICNGFQALVKLGLLPYGEIVDEMKQDMPTLTHNEINHHMSCIVRTKLVSNKSPWTYGLNVGEVTLVPISHGEGRFVASDSEIQHLIKNGQVVFQYVDYDGNATMKMPLNPNGSKYAIEAICSPDGRVLGKMGHSERIGENLYKNVYGKYDQKIFESGVNYFKK